MEKNVLCYKGYYTRPEYKAEDQIIYGKILGIDDLIDFYADTAKEVEHEFHKAVDDYLEFCEEIGKEPQKAYSGSFNVRISKELHRDATICAQANNMTLNAFVEQSIRRSVEQEDIVGKVCRTAAMTVHMLKYQISQTSGEQYQDNVNSDKTVYQQWGDTVGKFGGVSQC